MAVKSTYCMFIYLVMVLCRAVFIAAYGADISFKPILSENDKSTGDIVYTDMDTSLSEIHRHAHQVSQAEREFENSKHYDDIDTAKVVGDLAVKSDQMSENELKTKIEMEKSNEKLLNNNKLTETFIRLHERGSKVKRNVDAFEYPDRTVKPLTTVKPSKTALPKSFAKKTSRTSRIVTGKSPVTTVSSWQRKRKKKWRKPKRNKIRIGRKLRNEIKSFYNKQNISYTIEDGRFQPVPVFELLHNIEFLNTTQSILSLRHMQKKRLNQIYSVYMNNSLQLLRLESNLHHISTDLTTEGDIRNLDAAVENYRTHVEHLRTKASQDIRSSLKDIDTQSNQVMRNLAVHLNNTIEWKQYVSDQLEGVCAYLEVTEKQTLHDLKKVVRDKNRRINKLQREVDTLREENRRLRDEKSGINSINNLITNFKQEMLQNRQTMESVTSQLHSMGSTVSEIGYAFQQVTYDWKLHAFDYDNTWTDCYGPSYVKLSGNPSGHGKFVGVILCSKRKYKIFLGDDINGKFLNIGDKYGNGEDHCEFVSQLEAKFLSAMIGPTTEIEGYGRSKWGERVHRTNIGLANGYRSPKWYDCGVDIPRR